MTDRERRQARQEREKNRLVRLAADAEARRPDAASHTDVKLLDWLARDLAEPERGAERWSASRVDHAVARLRETLAAALLRVELAGGLPVERAPAVAGTVAATLAEARARRCSPRLALSIAAGVGRELWDEECESWVELPEGVAEGAYVSLTVSGDSMTPLLHSGDTVLVKIGREVAPNTVVVARHPDDGYVVKRVGRVSPERVELTSLNPAFGPVTVPRTEGSVVGTVVMRWCGHGASAVSQRGDSPSRAHDTRAGVRHRPPRGDP